MKTFQENLTGLPGIDDLARLDLLDADGGPVAAIENKAGSQGSLRVYRHLAEQFGAITPQAAQAGLELYAEHTADARAHPGKHPNIDRLFDIVDASQTLTAKLVRA